MDGASIWDFFWFHEACSYGFNWIHVMPWGKWQCFLAPSPQIEPKDERAQGKRQFAFQDGQCSQGWRVAASAPTPNVVYNSLTICLLPIGRYRSLMKFDLLIWPLHVNLSIPWISFSPSKETSKFSDARTSTYDGIFKVNIYIYVIYEYCDI